MQRVHGRCILVLSLLGAACSKPTPPENTAATAPSVSASASSSPSIAFSANDAGLSPALPLLDKLDYEAKHRGAAKPSVEQTFDALEKSGIKLTDKQQHVGAVFGAQYCSGARGDEDMAYDVCEFTDEASAKSGKEVSEKSFAATPNRTLVVNKATMLTLRQPAAKTPKTEALAKKAVDLFQKL